MNSMHASSLCPNESYTPTHACIPAGQGLDDHAHLPTLRLLPRTLPLVASPEAAEKVRPLGFKSVTVLDHGQTVEVRGRQLP